MSSVPSDYRNRFDVSQSSQAHDRHEYWLEKGSHSVYVFYCWNQANPAAIENRLMEMEDPEDPDAEFFVDNIILPLLEQEEEKGSFSLDPGKKKMISAFQLVDSMLVPTNPPGLDPDADLIFTHEARDIPLIALHDVQVLQAEERGTHAERVLHAGATYVLKSANFANEAGFIAREIKNLLRLGRQLKRCVPRIEGFVTVDRADRAAGRIVCGFLMEYFPLGDLTRHFGAPIDDKMCWLCHMVNVVAEMERVGFEHQDLKCENMLLLADGHIRIIDVGNHGFTEAWKYPEGFRVNMVFSLGKSVLELFTGARPITGFLTDAQLSGLGLPEIVAAVVLFCCHEGETPKASAVKEFLGTLL